MKRIIFILLTLVMTTSIPNTAVFSTVEQEGNNIVVEFISNNMQMQGIIPTGQERAYVNCVLIAKILNCSVTILDKSSGIIIESEKELVIFSRESNYVHIIRGDHYLRMEASNSFVMGEELMIPVRALLEALEYTVFWDGKTSTITVYETVFD